MNKKREEAPRQVPIYSNRHRRRRGGMLIGAAALPEKHRAPWSSDAAFYSCTSFRRTRATTTVISDIIVDALSLSLSLPTCSWTRERKRERGLFTLTRKGINVVSGEMLENRTLASSHPNADIPFRVFFFFIVHLHKIARASV